MNQFVTIVTKRDEILLRIISGVTSVEFVVDLKALHCATALTLRGHVKSGQRWSPENRPTEVAGD